MNDKEIQGILARPEHSGLKLKKIPVEDGNEIICDTSTGRDRPFLPAEWRKTAFHNVHDLEHMGIEKSKELLAEKYMWVAMKTDVGKWAQQCVGC